MAGNHMKLGGNLGDSGTFQKTIMKSRKIQEIKVNNRKWKEIS